MSYSVVFTVQPLQVDFQGNFSMIHLCDCILETASKHASELGLGITEMKEGNSAWVLTRLWLQVENYARVFDHLEVETWIDQVSSSFSTRKFNIYNQKKDLIASASTTWMLIDLKTRRPQLLEEKLFQPFIEKNRQCLTGDPEKLEPIPYNQEPFKFRVRYSDLDIQGHANSGKYIEWVLDQYSKEQFQKHVLHQVQINYLAECLFDDVMEVYTTQKAEGVYSTEILKQGKAACRGLTVWKER